MDFLNISLSILAIAVSIAAIFISIYQSRKSDKISLMSLRIEFYNKLCEILSTYKVFAHLKDIRSAKKADKYISNQNPIHLEILLSLGQGNVINGLKKITNDINFLNVNGYLFDNHILVEINIIKDKLIKLKQMCEKCISDKNNIDELQAILDNLRYTFDLGDKLLEKIKEVIKIKNIGV